MMLFYRHPEAAAELSYQRIRQTLKVWRQKSFPPIPKTMEAFIKGMKKVKKTNVLQYAENRRLIYKSVKDEHGNLHVVFKDEQLIIDHFYDCKIVLLDGTFCTRPSDIEDCYQLFILMGIRFNVGIPFGYALMSTKETEGYEACMKVLLKNVNVAHVNVVLADWELAIRANAKKFFPDARLAGCNPHFDRAIYHWVFVNDPTLLDDEEREKTFRRLLCMPFLPADKIEPAVDEVMSKCSAKTRLRMSRFVKYFKRQWLKIITPAGMSIFGLNRRSTNTMEGYNGNLQRILDVGSSPWEFVQKLAKCAKKTIQDLQHLLKSHKPLWLPRYESICKNSNLNTIWRLYVCKCINEIDLLDMVSAFKGDLKKNLEKIAKLSNFLSLKYDESLEGLDCNYSVFDQDFDFQLVNPRNETDKELEKYRKEIEHLADRVTIRQEMRARQQELQEMNQRVQLQLKYNEESDMEIEEDEGENKDENEFGTEKQEQPNESNEELISQLMFKELSQQQKHPEQQRQSLLPARKEIFTKNTGLSIKSIEVPQTLYKVCKQKPQSNITPTKTSYENIVTTTANTALVDRKKSLQ